MKQAELKNKVYDYIRLHPNVQTETILQAFSSESTWRMLNLLDELKKEGKIR